MYTLIYVAYVFGYSKKFINVNDMDRELHVFIKMKMKLSHTHKGICIWGSGNLQDTYNRQPQFLSHPTVHVAEAAHLHGQLRPTTSVGSRISRNWKVTGAVSFVALLLMPRIDGCHCRWGILGNNQRRCCNHHHYSSNICCLWNGKFGCQRNHPNSQMRSIVEFLQPYWPARDRRFLRIRCSNSCFCTSWTSRSRLPCPR